MPEYKMIDNVSLDILYINSICIGVSSMVRYGKHIEGGLLSTPSF